MRRSVNPAAVLTLAALLLAPSVTRAEGFISPWVGPAWGDQPVEADLAFGVALGGMGGGVFGGELDLGYVPDFFGEPVDNYALTGMVNLLIGVPIGGTTGFGVRPYLTGGVGLIRTSIDLPVDDAANNDFGYNLGGGVMGFFSDRLGLRGDVRYFRNVTSDLTDSDLDPEFRLGDLNFWRASVGIVIR